MNRVAKFGLWKKYRNQKTERDGIIYDSKLESKVGWELELRRKSGEFTSIERQVNFPLIVNGIKICTYRADFLATYPDGKQEVYEAKGMMMDVARIKLLLFEATHPHIKLTIVRA